MGANDVTILVNGCDKYSSSWEPFFKLFAIQWPECPCEFVLNTESKNFDFRDLNVRCVHSNPAWTWTKRLRNVLQHIDSKYVLFFIEDYFVLKPVNQEGFARAVELMDAHDEVGMVSLAQTNRQGIATDDINTDYFYSRMINPACMIWCRTNLYRKTYLLELLRDHENIWEFEAYASYRARRLDSIICQQNNQYPEIFSFDIAVEHGYGITRQKWLPRNRELFAQYGIDVDFDELGFLEDSTVTKPTKEVSDHSSKQSKRQTFREAGYRIKQIFKHARKRIRKGWRAIRSKHM